MGKQKEYYKKCSKNDVINGKFPYDFVINHNNSDLNSLNNFVHRTFNGIDFIQFIKSLKHIYINHGGLELVFSKNTTPNDTQAAIHHFKTLFFEIYIHLEQENMLVTL